MDSYFFTALKIGLLQGIVLLVLFGSSVDQALRFGRIFLLGMVVCSAACVFNTHWMLAVSAFLNAKSDGTQIFGPFRNVLLSAMLWILLAPVEELLKYAVVRAGAGRRSRLDHPRDGSFLAAGAALGFATYENYFYMLQRGYEVIYTRAWLCPPGHILWSAIWGYYLGLIWQNKAPRAAIVEGLLLASLFHGLHNFLTTLIPGIFGLVIPIFLLVGLGRYYQRRLWTGEHRPFLATTSRRRASVLPLSQRRFPETQLELAALLDRLDAADEQTRIAALKEAASVHDQRSYERVLKLTRDPVEAVRVAAGAACKQLQAKLPVN